MTESTDICEVCRQPLAITHQASYDGVSQSCRRCGCFKVSGSAAAIFNNSGLGADLRAKLSGWIYDQNIAGNGQPEIHEYNYKSILERQLPGVIERAERILCCAAKRCEELNSKVRNDSPDFYAASYSKDAQEVYRLIGYLRDQGYTQSHSMESFQLSIEGWAKVEQLSNRVARDSRQGFVAMWFGEEVRPAWLEGIEPAIRNAGFDPLRIDQAEHVNRIDDEIIKQINKSRFIVADFTGHRGGVYFEAGYAMGLDIPIFWTCRKDHMSDLHFDIRQFNCIDWETPEELKDRLQRRIEAVLN